MLDSDVMRSVRLASSVLVSLAALAALAGCSGSADDKPSAESSSARPTEVTHAPAEFFERTCQVQVDVTGAATASWSGKGRASDEAGPTIYKAEDGDDQITVYAGKGDIDTNANVTIDGATYTTTSEAGLDVAGNGTSATVDADTAGVKGAGPHVTATFTCGKG